MRYDCQMQLFSVWSVDCLGDILLKCLTKLYTISIVTETLSSKAMANPFIVGSYSLGDSMRTVKYHCIDGAFTADDGAGCTVT